MLWRFIKKHWRLLVGLLTMASLLLLASFWAASGYPRDLLSERGVRGRLQINFLAVGQGDAILIRTPKGQDILIDGGPDNSVLGKLGRYLPFFDRYLDLVILTHGHADHLDGLVSVLERYGIGEVIDNGFNSNESSFINYQDLIRDKNISHQTILKDQKIILGPDLALDIFSPIVLSSSTSANLNNTSLVIRLEYASTSVLLMGDYEDEEKLVADNQQLRSNILKVGHHGSSNANSWEFLQAVDPQYAVISVGRDNKFGLPDYRVLYYLKKLSADVLRTDDLGDIRFVSDGQRFYRF